jgi:Fur family peroxide stress response transcriptional regulator
LTERKIFIILKSVTITIIDGMERVVPMRKYSRQREAIKTFLAGRYDHPTAETVYMNIREEFPNISLGTVYRNLSLLAEIGEIQKLSPGMGADRFDANTSPHYHFICNHCGSVLDLKVEGLDHINILAGQGFDGEIEGHIAYFYGKCRCCLQSAQHSADEPAANG